MLLVFIVDKAFSVSLEMSLEREIDFVDVKTLIKTF